MVRRMAPKYGVAEKLIWLRGEQARKRQDLRNYQARVARGENTDGEAAPRYREREIQILEDMIADYEAWQARAAEKK